MPDFHAQLMRHGSSWILYLVEQIERVEGIKHKTLLPLEDRWAFLERNTPFQQKAA